MRVAAHVVDTAVNHAELVQQAQAIEEVLNNYSGR